MFIFVYIVLLAAFLCFCFYFSNIIADQAKNACKISYVSGFRVEVYEYHLRSPHFPAYPPSTSCTLQRTRNAKHKTNDTSWDKAPVLFSSSIATTRVADFFIGRPANSVHMQGDCIFQLSSRSRTVLLKLQYSRQVPMVQCLAHLPVVLIGHLLKLCISLQDAVRISDQRSN